MTKIGTDSLSWNLNGNLDNSVTASFTYDWDNKLRFAQSGSNTIEIRYDVRGNRIYKSVDDGENVTERKYIVDIVGRLPVILCEIDPQNGGSLTNKYYYANSQILAQDAVYYTDPNDPNTIGFDRYYYLQNRLGSIRQVIDSSAATVATYTYNPYGEDFTGECNETIYNPFKFTGQWYDSKTGQYCLRARQYEPQLMRFTGSDPVKGKLSRPLSLHKHLYTNNDPVNRVDPRGLFSVSATAYVDKLRRPYLEYQGRKYAALNQAGGISALDAMIDLTKSTAFFYSYKGADRTAFVEDLLWMFTERSLASGMRPVRDNLKLIFDDTGFHERYRDGGNQVRHFMGCMGAGYYFGQAVGMAAVVHNEITGFYTTEDIALGIEGINLGAAIDKNIWGYYAMGIDQVGDWMGGRLGE